jgi:hypothetical protein
MLFRRFLAPLLGAVILAFTALFGAGVASAHPGHAHGVAKGAVPAAPISHVVEEAAVPAPSAALSVEAVPEALAATPMSFDVAVNEAPRRELAGTGCIDMCCENAPCGGCLKLTLGKASLPAPPLGVWLPASVEARKLTGRLAEGPNKPPRTFI